MKPQIARRGFLAAAAGAAVSQGQSKGLGRVRAGLIGVGGRGTGHARNLLGIDTVELKAVCDLVPSKVENVQNLAQKAGKERPTAYTKGELDYKRLCARNDLDIVYIATPWEWHARMAVEAMKSGKPAASEVPAATTLEECWELVETAESTGRYCIQLENCCYDRVELMAFHMARKNLLGELVHAECGYLHDLRAMKYSGRGEGMWRLDHALRRNADLYPTHGLGPVAQTLDINRGNLFDHMVSMASKSHSLREYAVRTFGADSPKARLDVALGDVVSSLIRTRAGQTILVVHDTNAPRPYSRKVLVQGSRGLIEKYPAPRIYLEGKSKPHEWEDLFPAYEAEWEHPLWRSLQERAKGSGHGGMDFIMNYRLADSIAARSRTMDFPDFTRGKWRARQPLAIARV